MEASNPLYTAPPSLNSHSPAELSPNSSVEPHAGDSSTASSLAGEYPNIGLGAAECVTTCNQSAGPSCIDVQQPDAACISTDLKFDIWANELINDSDRDFILTGIREGFDLIQRDANVLPAFTKNNKSALRPGAKEQIEEQLCKGLLQGHFALPKTPPAIVNAIGAVPKRDSSELRMTMDCSRPFAVSANSYMDLDHYKYVTVDEAACKAKPHFWLAKVDLKHAYRSVGTHPNSWKVTGMSWHFKGSANTTFLYDKRLPFGARTSPMIFQRLTQSVCRMARRGFTVLAYLDDFLIIEPTQQQCQIALDTLINLPQSLGFTINWSKVVQPSQSLCFLGVEIDTVNRELRLPSNRVSELLELLNLTMSKRKCSKHHLQRIVGKLSWAARVVRGGRTFLRRLITVMNSVKRRHHHVYLNTQARADLQWWASLLPVFNCKSLFLEEFPRTSAPAYTDASTAGGGCCWQNDWLYVNWTLDFPDIYSLHINYKETFMILQAVKRWAPSWSGQRVFIKTDSEVAATIVNKGTTPCPIIMDWLRELFWLLEFHAIRLTVEHIPGSSNVIADSISRLDDKCHQDTLRAWLSQSSSSTKDLLSHMSPLSLAILRPRRPVEIRHGSS